MTFIDRIDYGRLIGYYLLTLVAAPFIAALLFFFPIIQIWEAMGWEFSNLGPIATFVWGVLFDVVIATPVFVLLFFAKLLRRNATA